jgi:hypothetical protein
LEAVGWTALRQFVRQVFCMIDCRHLISQVLPISAYHGEAVMIRAVNFDAIQHSLP